MVVAAWMFDIQTRPRTGLLNGVSPGGSWENPWYALITQTLSPAGMKKDAEKKGMAGWRYAGKKKKKNVPCQQHTRQHLPSGGIHAAHRESVQTLLTCHRQVLSRPRWYEWVVGNPEQGEYRAVQINAASRCIGSGESQAQSQALVRLVR